jgi:hypothetical protein
VELRVREQALDIWRAAVAYSFRSGTWQWGGRSGSNSISDAEQLLCILYPATNISELRLDEMDRTAGDVLDSLKQLGSQFDVLRTLVAVLREYLERYLDGDGLPEFTAGGYLEPRTGHPDATTTAEQASLDIVDAFSMSITLCLSTLGFTQTLRSHVTSRRLLDDLDHVDKLTSERLTAAMVGLLRSFSVNVFSATSAEGQVLCNTVNQTREPDRVIADRLARALKEIRGSLKEELAIGSGQVGDELEDQDALFECGWSWGIIKDAPEIEGLKVAGQRPGVAEDRPYLYFTGVALDGIEDLFSERTRMLGLLDEQQQRLAGALQLRWDLCMKFWETVATFGPGRWPIEDIPWRTTDDTEADHFSLLVCSILIHQVHFRGTRTARTARLGQVLEELANRGRITRRPVRGEDPATAVHSPGTRLPLVGSELLGPMQQWTISSYSSLLLKRTIQLVGLAATTEDREQLTSLADRLWEHLLRRRLTAGGREGLWDQPGAVLPSVTVRHQEPSWYHTQRIAECLVAATHVLDRPLPVSPSLRSLASDYLTEAEHLFDNELLSGTWSSSGQPAGTANGAVGHRQTRQAQSIAARLERARGLQNHRPGTAVVLAQQVLAELDELAKARSRSLTEGLL